MMKNLKLKIEIFIRFISDSNRKHLFSLIGDILGVFSILLSKINFNKLSIILALRSHRLSYSQNSHCVVNKFLSNKYNEYNIIKNMISCPLTLKEAAGRSLIVRWPVFLNNKVVSKGIIIISFTENFPFYLKNINLNKFEDYFHIVLEPSFAGYFDPDILSWALFCKNPVFIQSSEIYDRVSIGLLNNNLIPISIGASDWVDYHVFYPLQIKKQYDSVYVANTQRFKRIHRYLQAIAEIKAQGCLDYRGALVCASWGERTCEVQDFIDYYDVNKECEVFFNLDIESLREIICKSKVNILLSLKEGSNRSLFESMFCNVPAICLVDNLGVNKFYINEFTGMLTWDSHLVSALLSMRDNWSRYQPREWAMKNICPEMSNEKLCTIISNSTGDKILLNDLKEMKNIYIKVNRPEMQYFNLGQLDKIEINTKIFEIFSKEKDLENYEIELNSLIINFESKISPVK